jgi:hypothetical protein
MSRIKESKEHKLKLEPEFAAEIKRSIEEQGGQDAFAARIGVDQSSISRVCKPGPTTVSMLMKILAQIPDAPPPFVMSKNKRHAEWCQLGAVLIDAKPTQFEEAMRNAENVARLVGIGDDTWSKTLHDTLSDESASALKSLISSPLRASQKKGVRRG